jgi:hypothetical protein
VKAFANIWLIHRKEMCRFGLTSGRTWQANMIVVSCEWSGLYELQSLWLVCISHTIAVHSRICIMGNQKYCSVWYKKIMTLEALAGKAPRRWKTNHSMVKWLVSSL